MTNWHLFVRWMPFCGWLYFHCLWFFFQYITRRLMMTNYWLMLLFHLVMLFNSGDYLVMMINSVFISLGLVPALSSLRYYRLTLCLFNVILSLYIGWWFNILLVVISSYFNKVLLLWSGYTRFSALPFVSPYFHGFIALLFIFSIFFGLFNRVLFNCYCRCLFYGLDGLWFLGPILLRMSLPSG